MTAVEKSISSECILPTDLSLKRYLGVKCNKETNKYRAHSPWLSADQNCNKKRRLSWNEDSGKYWNNEANQDQRPLSSPSAENLNSSFTNQESSVFYMQNQQNAYDLNDLFSNHSEKNHFFVSNKQFFRRQSKSDEESEKSEESSSLAQSFMALVKSLNKKHRDVFISEEPIFNHNYHLNRHCVEDSNPTNNSKLTKTSKRKGGWKFHDLSEDGDVALKRKRPYGQNRLENEILQLYQNRVIIKEVPGTAGLKAGEKIITIEPSCISDPDLIHYNTSLRIVLNKKQGIYQFQVLPFTVEEGPLSNKNQVLSIVSKMLGENGFVLCPGIKERISSHFELSHDHPSNLALSQKHSMVQGNSNQNKYNSKNNSNREKWTLLSNSNFSSKGGVTKSLESSTAERLIMSLNNELTQASTLAKQELLLDDAVCLLWHVPTLVKKGKRITWPKELKWCDNCLKKLQKQ